VQNLSRRLDFNTGDLAKFLAGEISRFTLREFKARDRREQRCKQKGGRDAFGVGPRRYGRRRYPTHRPALSPSNRSGHLKEKTSGA